MIQLMNSYSNNIGQNGKGNGTQKSEHAAV